MTIRKLLCLALAACMLLSVTAVASAEGEKTFTVGINRWTQTWGTDFTQTAFLKEIGEATGVTIDWQPYYNDNWGDQKSLMLASGLSALPDAFFGAITISDSDILANPEYFVELSEYITPEIMPNLTAIFESDPSMKALCTDSEGNIWSLPKKLPLRPQSANQMFINKTWLDELGLDIPNTYEELAEAMIAFSSMGDDCYGEIRAASLAGDLNGLLLPFSTLVSRDGNFMGINADGDPYFVPASENYKEAVKWAHELYVAGALDPERFTLTSDMVRAKIADAESGPRTGIVFAWTADAEVQLNKDHYVVCPAVIGPDGQRHVESDPTYLNYGHNELVITKNCSDPAALLTWADQFYTDLASLQTYYGSIDDGKIAVHDDGTYEVLVPDPSTGIDLDASCWTYSFRDHGPKYMSEEFESKIILPQDVGDGVKLAIDAADVDAIHPNFPMCSYTAAELDDIAFLATDINSYASQTYADWVVNGGVDEGWDAYINQLNAMGLEDLVAIHVGAYERYIAQ